MLLSGTDNRKTVLILSKAFRLVIDGTCTEEEVIGKGHKFFSLKSKVQFIVPFPERLKNFSSSLFAGKGRGNSLICENNDRDGIISQV